MPQYGDEKIIYAMANQEARNEGNEIRNDIKNGYVIIDENHIPFSEREIMKDRLYMTIPADFVLMEPELAEFKYPSRNRPHIIFTDAEGEINITFTTTEAKLENEDIEDAKESLQRIILKLNPLCKIISDSIIEDEVRIGCFDYISTAIDSDIYNLIFIFPLDGQFILGTFNCLHLDMAKWREVAGQMVRSVRTAPGVY